MREWKSAISARRALADVNQTVFAAIGERTQRHAPDNAEHGAIRADAEAKCDDYGRSQAFGALQ
jgi:hypothetical protein